MSQKIYSDKDLIKLVKIRAQELGRAPLRRELPQGRNVGKRFGNWANALRLAGLTPNVNKHYGDLSDEEFERLTVLGRSEDKADDKHVYWVCICECGGLTKVQGSALLNGKRRSCGCLLADLKRDPFAESYDADDLLMAIKIKAKKLGRTPHRRELSQGTFIVIKFGSWNKAIEKAGLPALESCDGLTDDEMLDIVRAKAEEIGRSPYQHELAQGIDIGLRFGGWNRALELAGVAPTKVTVGNLTNREFYRLKVIKKSTIANLGGYFLWLCECKCGRLTYAHGYALLNGKRRSCGCLNIEHARRQAAINIRKMLVEGTHLGVISSTKISVRNTSGVRGVSYDRKNKLWVAQIGFQKRSIIIKSSTHKSVAVQARKEAERAYFEPVIEKYKHAES